MTQTAWKPRVEGVIPVLPEEIAELEAQVKRFQAGEWKETEFQAFRLKQGVYGQRQPDAQMIRAKAPFGGLTSDMLDAFGVVAERYAPLGKGHLTTRENVQFHHVKLDEAAEVLRVLGDAGISTREACGNTVRNVTGCPMAGVCALEPFDVTPYAAAYARYFVRHPLTQAMPRKFKTAFSGCEKDCAITAIHDLGFVPRVVDGRKGFEVKTGGGTSIMPRLAQTLYDFVGVEDYLRVAEAVIRIFNRSDELRKNKMKARIKFFIDRVGIEQFRGMVDAELREPWAQRSFDPGPLLCADDESVAAPVPPPGGYGRNGHSPEFERWIGTNVEAQKQEPYMAVTVKVPLGDITATQFHALADLARRCAGGRARTTAQQNLILRWVHPEALYTVWETLGRIGLDEAGALDITDVVSCPGTDSCKLGITSSMGLARAITRELGTMDLSDPLVRRMHVKMSGCPNGCGHHHVADVGFHGAAVKAPGGQVPAYELFLGGGYSRDGSRLGLRLKHKVPAKMAPAAFREVILYYLSHRSDGEAFRDFVAKVGVAPFEEIAARHREERPLGKESIDGYMDWGRTVIYKLERGEGECAS